MSTGSWEFIATDEPAVIAKPFLDTIVVESGEGDRSFPDPSRTDESDGFQVFGKTNDLLNQPIASETGPGFRRRQFSRGNAMLEVRLWTRDVRNR